MCGPKSCAMASTDSLSFVDDVPSGSGEIDQSELEDPLMSLGLATRPSDVRLLSCLHSLVHAAAT